MSRYSTSILADRLYGCFEAIYRQWQEHAPRDTHLWELSMGKSTIDIIEKDMINIGHYFSAADGIGERSEIYLIADYIAHFRALNAGLDTPKTLDKPATQIGDWLVLHPELANDQRTKIYAPLCFRISQLTAAHGLIADQTLNYLRETLIDIAYHFLLHDGNITPEEETRLKQFHAALS